MDFNTFIVSNTGRDLEYHRRARTVGIEFAENAYKAGVLAEREACAKICETALDLLQNSTFDGVAAAIRARK